MPNDLFLNAFLKTVGNLAPFTTAVVALGKDAIPKKQYLNRMNEECLRDAQM